MRITSLSRRRKAFAALGVAAVAAAAAVAVAPNASAASAALTLSATSGPSGGGNALTATTATNVFATGTNVEFQYKATSSTTCSAAYSTPVTPATGVGIVAITSSNVKVLSAKKIAFTVPAGVTLTPAGSASTASWLVCVYPGTNTTTSLLAANAAYTVGAAPTVTAISPAGGPALGGGTITITGTNFTSTTTAKIGSVPLTGVTVTGTTSLTGTVPAQAAGAMNVSVSNTGGTSAPAASNASQYTYSNGIVVSPNTAPTNTAATDVDIQGVGFSSLTFTTTTGTTPDDNKAHVYLVDGDYDGSGSTKAKGELGECLNVLVISDGELICTVNTADSDGAGSAGAVIPNGTYTLTVVSNGQADIGTGGANEDLTFTKSIVSSGSTFTVAPY
jgi:IPT/TIG domain